MNAPNPDTNYFEELEALRLAYPALTYNNHGYDNIDPAVREANAEGQAKIEALLTEAVAGFVRFQNFKPRDDGTFAIRCQTKWDDRFTGVSYFPMSDFKPDSPTWSRSTPTHTKCSTCGSPVLPGRCCGVCEPLKPVGGTR